MFERTPIYKLCQKIIAINEDRVFSVVLDVQEVKDLIIDLNTSKQLREQHIDKLGEKLFNNYSNRDYYGSGDELGRAGQPYEVYNTGAYFDSFKVNVGNGFILIESDPIKDGDSLFEMYTENIEGLSAESMIELQSFAKDLYLRYFRNELLKR
jgi:hypothetical protein